MSKREFKLTEKNYYTVAADKRYMSVSQFKEFERCEAAALARLKGKNKRKPPSVAMLVGSYVDAYFGGTLPQFKAENPQVFKRDGTLKAEFLQAEVVISRILKQRQMMRYFSGEKQRIFTGEIAGVPFKCKIDSFLPNKAIVDGKVMKDFAPVYKEGEGRLPWFEAWGYDLQGAVYQELVRQNTGKRLPFILNAATKEEEPDLVLINVDQALMDYELDHVKESAPRYDAIKQGLIKPVRCENCAYCRRTKKVKLINSEELDYENE